MNDSIEILRRLHRRNGKPIRFTKYGKIHEWRLIPARKARNWDGSLAGCDDADSDRQILTRITITLKTGETRHANWW